MKNNSFEQTGRGRLRGWLVVFFVMAYLGEALGWYGLLHAQLVVHVSAITWKTIVVRAAMLGLITYVLIAFRRRRPDAVFAARLLVGYFLVSKLFYVVVSLMRFSSVDILVFNLISPLLGLLLWGGWLAYFHRSKQVERLCPREMRHIGPGDWALTAVMALFYLYCVATGLPKPAPKPSAEFGGTGSPELTIRLACGGNGYEAWEEGKAAFDTLAAMQLGESLAPALPAGETHPLTPVMAYAEGSDTAALNARIGAYLGEHPECPFHYLWAAQPDDTSNRFALYALHGEALLDGSALTCTQVTRSRWTDFYEITLIMTPDGSARWADLTEQYICHCLAIVLGDKVLCAPNVNGRIEGGRSQITGDYTEATATALARRIMGQ